MLRIFGITLLTCAGRTHSLPTDAITPAASQDALRAGFVAPPDSAKPRVWWHWMNGNITKQGIQHDIEWMHRVGLGGMQTFDAAFDTPQLDAKRLVYMTPAWKEAFVSGATLADRSGPEVHGGPGAG